TAAGVQEVGAGCRACQADPRFCDHPAARGGLQVLFGPRILWITLWNRCGLLRWTPRISGPIFNCTKIRQSRKPLILLFILRGCNKLLIPNKDL
ncbi:hypothetical protein, partial [Paracoccus sphaerophysae]|uniref:hypothetical protein n=1 Tax=Paracoccus sphaerophysae TaxID=690417 RepID=UPI002358509F